MKNRVRGLFVVSWLVGVLVFVLSPGLPGHLAFQATIGLTVAMMAGAVIRFRPPNRLGWWLFTGTVTGWWVGCLILDYYVFVLRQAVPAVSVADAVNVVAFGLDILANVVLLRAQRAPRDREARLDVIIVVVAVLAAAWVLLIQPVWGLPGLPGLGRVVSSIYPLCDVFVLALLVRILLVPGRRPTCVYLLIGANAAGFVGDSLTALVGPTSPVVQRWAWLYYMVYALFFGLAALDRSMTRLGEVARPGLPRLGLSRLVGLGTALMLGPVSAVVGWARGMRPNFGMLVFVTLVLTVLVLTRLRWLVQQTEHIAFHDPLTGLPNRALFADRLSSALARAARGNGAVGVLFIDLDNFKTINDGLGHEAGDRLLQVVGERFRMALRSCDTVVRFGGDEFAVIVEALESPEVAVGLAERLQRVLGAPVLLAGATVHPTASIGVAVGGIGATAGDLVRDADAAMYVAKNAGKDRIEAFMPDMHTKVMTRLDLELGLHAAIDRDEFVLEYQPALDLRTRQTYGFEALLRWARPDGVIGPNQFIPLAEETGLIVPIGRWVLNRACAEAVTWHTDDARPLTVAVNVSTRQLESPDFVGDVRAALARSGLPPERLVLEITESALMINAELSIQRLRELKAIGTRIAIDDFGTGYSSLSYLQRLPVDIIKIDKSFIDELTVSDSSDALIRSLVDLGRNLDLDTVAEGIETSNQADTLQANGCLHGQGYLFARPMPAHQVPHYLASHTTAQAGHRERVNVEK